MRHFAMACWAGAALAAAVLPATARAQGGGLRDAAALQSFERQLERFQRETRLRVDPSVPADQRAVFDWGGYLTLSYLTLDDQYNRNHGLRQYDLVGYARLNLDGAHEFYASARASWRDFNPGDSFDGQGDEYVADLDRAYYRFDLQRFLAAYYGEQVDYNLVFTGGRQLVSWGNGLTLSAVLDSAVVDLEYTRRPTATDEQPLTVRLELLAGITPRRTVDIDSTRPHFDDNTFRGFYGAMLSTTVGAHRPYVYALFQQDYNHSYTSDIGIIETRFDYYSWYLGCGANGSLTDNLLYGVEAVYEGGTGLSNSFEEDTFFPIKQTTEDIQAWAADVRLDYFLRDDWNTRLSFETILASGDTDRLHNSNTFGGNRPGTNDHSFNAFGLLNTGLAFAPTVSNVAILRFGAAAFPFGSYGALRRLQVGTDVFVYNKLRRGGAIDETTSDGRYLGVEPDVYINWQITSDLTMVLRYGAFFPNSDVIPDDTVRQFFYAGMTLSF